MALRCRLITSWGWLYPGFGCSLIKVVRELAENVVRQFGPYLPWVKETCEALSPSMRGPGWTRLFRTGYHASGTAEVAT